MQLVRTLFSENAECVPPDSLLMLASTVGEIDFLEQAIIEKCAGVEKSALPFLLQRISDLLALDERGLVVSAACASGSVAVAEGASLIANGVKDSVLVVACDAVTEFVYSGFSALMALDILGARPFDRERGGLTLGEGAAYVLMMSEERALKESRTIVGTIDGWGIASDANHLTAPARDGRGLQAAIQQALVCAELSVSDICSISAHGTGTLYNDAMELTAFTALFEEPVPTYSLKGGIGHTMGAAGLIELIVALKSISEKCVPGTINFKKGDSVSDRWISSECCSSVCGPVLSTNSGFGGVNAALVINGVR